MSTKTKRALRKPREQKPKNYGTLGFLPISEVVARTGLDKCVVWREIHSGRLHGIKFSTKVWRVHETELAAWVERMRSGNMERTEA